MDTLPRIPPPITTLMFAHRTLRLRSRPCRHKKQPRSRVKPYNRDNSSQYTHPSFPHTYALVNTIAHTILSSNVEPLGYFPKSTFVISIGIRASVSSPSAPEIALNAPIVSVVCTMNQGFRGGDKLEGVGRLPSNEPTDFLPLLDHLYVQHNCRRSWRRYGWPNSSRDRKRVYLGIYPKGSTTGLCRQQY